MPVGGIIAWPKDSNPSTSSNIWLECNGQSFDTDRFPKLYKVLGSNKTPNFQGMFLRGAGSQTYSQVNGTMVNFDYDWKTFTNHGKTPTNYTSGAVGEIQGDSARRDIGANMTATMQILFDGVEYGGIWEVPEYGGGWYAPLYMDGSYRHVSHLCSNTAQLDLGDLLRPIKIKLPLNPKHYRYSISGDAESGYDLQEYTSEGEEGTEYYTVTFFAQDISHDNLLIWPIDNEFRPANIAVKYYIRAK